LSTADDHDVFLADLCHRVRTPLNGILGTLELLLEGDLADESRELARVAYDSAVVLHLVFEHDLQAAVDDPTDLAG
jgi:signal transduction histidine kinase